MASVHLYFISAAVGLSRSCDHYCEVSELMLTPLRLIEVVLLLSDDVDSPLCIKCVGIALIDSKNFL